jgi:hypothetical protein
MKLNEKSIKNDLNKINKFDFSNTYANNNHTNSQNTSIKLSNNYGNDNNKINIDPRLELTLKYLDITSTLEIFINNNISFNDLLLLSKKDLIELGFSLVERNRIFTFAQEYKNYGVQYNISEINEFFNNYENLNIRLVTNGNHNQYNTRKKENINENINSDFINNKNNNNHYNNKSLLLEKNQNNKSSAKKKKATKNIIIQKQNNISLDNEKDNYKTNIKYKTNISLKYNKQNNSNTNNYISQESNYQDSINTNHNNINNNYTQTSGKLVRQNSKISKASSYSRPVTASKNIGGGLGTSSGSIFQKYQNISDEIDNYFRKYNEYKEQKKNRMKRYEIIGSSNKRKNYNYNPVYNNIVKETEKTKGKFEEENIRKNKEDEINKKLLELQKRKQELKDKLNIICEKENKKLMLIKYLEEEDDK